MDTSVFQDFLQRLLVFIPVLLLSLTVHEFAHAWTARRYGDDTAERMGRLTLNPLAHADPLGTFILPLLNVPFGWAKPVPVNPARFRRDVSMASGMMWTSLAGPIANVLLALVSTLLLGVLIRAAPDPAGVGGGQGLPGILALFLYRMMQMNVVLAVFNLLPIPPLDGSRVVAWLLPSSMADTWRQVEAFAPLLLIAVFLWGSRLVSGPIAAVYRQLENLIYLIA